MFGCVAFAHVRDADRQKLDKKAKKMRFVGYNKNPKGYRLYDATTRKLKVCRDVEFNEEDFGQKEVHMNVSDVQQTDEVPVQVKVKQLGQQPPQEVMPEKHDQPEDIHPRRSERELKKPVRYGIDEHASNANTCFHMAYNMSQSAEPKTLQEALMSDQASEWKVAADSEYKSLMDNTT